MTHNYQAASRLKERAAAAEERNDDAEAAYEDEEVLGRESHVVGV